MAGERVLIIDDEDALRWVLKERLTSAGFLIDDVGSGAEAMSAVRGRAAYDGVLLDYKLPDDDGLSVLRSIKAHDPDILVILLTAHTGVEIAVEAMKQGAYHYVNKPFNLDEISILVEKALETTRLRREVRTLRESQARPYSFDRIVGEGPAVSAVKAAGVVVGATAGGAVGAVAWLVAARLHAAITTVRPAAVRSAPRVITNLCMAHVYLADLGFS